MYHQIEATVVFFRSMASEKMSNRSKKVLLSASDDTLEVRRSKKIETEKFSKYDFPHKTLTKYKVFSPIKPLSQHQPQIWTHTSISAWVVSAGRGVHAGRLFFVNL